LCNYGKKIALDECWIKRASRSLKRRKEKIYEKGRQIIGDDISGFLRMLFMAEV